MKVYSPYEISELLNIKQPTLRKYSIMLEEHGYNISRNSQNHRYYHDKDIITLRRVIEGRNKGATLEESIKNVVSLNEDNTYTNDINNNDTYDNNDIIELLQKQNELIKNLTNRLDQQQRYIEDKIEARDKQLMEYMNKSLEEKKKLSEPPQNESKKGILKRLFNK